MTLTIKSNQKHEARSQNKIKSSEMFVLNLEDLNDNGLKQLTKVTSNFQVAI